MGVTKLRDDQQNQSVNLTSEVTGTLPVTNGGTGTTTLTGIVKGNGTSAMTAVTAPSGAIVGTTDTQTMTSKTLTSPKIGTSILDTNSAVLMAISPTNPAGNYLVLTNGASGGSPDPGFSAEGIDSTIHIAFTPKGAGRLKVGSVNVPTISSTDTLTSKTISGSSNTITNITNSALSTTAGELGGAWQSWTPSWGKLTVGNGTLNYAVYTQIGKTVHFRLKFTLGSTSSIASPGEMTVSAPVTFNSSYTQAASEPIGTAIIRDASTFTNQTGLSLFYDSTNISIRYTSSSSAATVITGTAPFSFATSDIISIEGKYEAA